MAGPYIRTFWTVAGQVDKDGHPIEYPTEAAARAQSSGGGIAGTGVGAGQGPIPAATPATKVTEVMTEDGEYVQTTEGPDGQPQEIGRGVDKARLDLYKVRREAAPDALTPAQALTEARAGRTEERAVRTEERAERREQREITAAEATARATALREERANNIAERKMTIDEADREYDRKYREQVEIPLKLSAEARAVRAAQRQEEADRRTERTEITRSRESEAEFGQKAGRNAVADALALLPYQVSPTFLREFAAGLNTLSSGGGHVAFSPEAFQIQLPDLNALADAGAARAAAAYRGTAGVPFTPQGAVAGAAPQPMSVQQSLAAAPLQPRPMPGAMPPQIQAGSVGGEPSQEELARRLAAGYGP